MIDDPYHIHIIINIIIIDTWLEILQILSSLVTETLLSKQASRHIKARILITHQTN